MSLTFFNMRRRQERERAEQSAQAQAEAKTTAEPVKKTVVRSKRAVTKKNDTDK